MPVKTMATDGLRVQSNMCSTCIFKPGSPLDLEALLDQVRDAYMGFKGHRICHHSDDACCAGFWANHKDEFPAGQLAQRLGCVVMVNDDNFKKINKAKNV